MFRVIKYHWKWRINYRFERMGTNEWFTYRMPIGKTRHQFVTIIEWQTRDHTRRSHKQMLSDLHASFCNSFGRNYRPMGFIHQFFLCLVTVSIFPVWFGQRQASQPELLARTSSMHARRREYSVELCCGIANKNRESFVVWVGRDDDEWVSQRKECADCLCHHRPIGS